MKKATEIEKTGDKPTSPFVDMERYFSELEKSMFGNLVFRPMIWPFSATGERAAAAREPRVDIIDQDKDILVKAEMPGMDKKDVKIDLTDHTLHINAEHKKEKKEEKENYYRREISSTRFSRSIALPESVDITQAKASFKDGILEIKLPKSGESKSRSISIS